MEEKTNTCSHCLFFKADGERWGTCRRFPPDPTVNTGMALFPYLDKKEWCGEFRDKNSPNQRQIVTWRDED